MKDYLRRAYLFFKRNILTNTGYIFSYAFHYLQPGYRIHPRFLSEDELLTTVEDGLSLVRINDGEIYLINYGLIHYQDFHPRLRQYMLDIVQQYGPDSPYRIGLPEQYLSQSNLELRKSKLLRCYLSSKMAYQQLFNKHMPYFDAHLFYRGKSFERVLEKVLRGKRVLLVTSAGNWKLMEEAGLKEKLDVSLIECKPKNSFDEFDLLLQRIYDPIPAGHEKDFRVLVSAGPTSKALVYELSKKGIITYDLGRGIEAVYRPNEIESAI